MILVDQFEKTVSIKNKKQKRKHETFEKVLKSVISENETQKLILIASWAIVHLA